MSTMTNILHTSVSLKHGYDESLNRYYVVHPLDDVAEQKIDTANLGPMVMTRAVRWSLLTLRVYLILISVLVLVRVLRLAGI